jgi:mannose-6-phosphate isomerase-like protein (cupin superfamily)
VSIHLPNISECRPIDARLPDSGDSSRLAVFENGRQVPFAVDRVFLIHADRATKRGNHAHRRCSQALICVSGTCEVTVDDGRTRKKIVLSGPDRGVLVPAGIWAEQSYKTPGTILMVLCDLRYDEGDYIRDYDAFLRYRNEYALTAVVP